MTLPAGQIERDVVEHEPVGAGIRERDVLEANPFCQPDWSGLIGRRDYRLRVVLEPGQPPCGIHPDSAQEANLAHCGAHIERETRPGRQRQEHVVCRRPQTRRDEHDRADIPCAKDRPRHGMPACGRPPRRGNGSIARFPGLPALPEQPIADAGDPHLLPGRGGGRHVEQMAGKTGRRCAAFVRVTFDGRPPRRREHGRQGKQREQRQSRMNGDEQRNRDRRDAGSIHTSRTATCTCGPA